MLVLLTAESKITMLVINGSYHVTMQSSKVKPVFFQKVKVIKITSI